MVLDRQGSLESGATEYFNRSWVANNEIAGKRFASISYQDSRDVPAIQIADLYAYAWGRYLEGSANTEIHHTMRRLTRAKPFLGLADAGYFKKELGRLDSEDLAIEDRFIRLTNNALEAKYDDREQS